MATNNIGPLKTVELYGGAFSIQYPERFTDISQYRHIPNHQEVYIDPNGDQSIIVELNSYQDVPNKDAAEHHWKDLMKDSDGTSLTISHKGEFTKDDLPNLSEYIDYVGFIQGVNKVGKYKEESLNTIKTFILNFRMKAVTTDMLIIFNIPLEISQESTAAIMVTEGGKDGVEKQHEMNDEDKPKMNLLSEEESDILIKTVIKSFKILSMNIFPEMQ